MKYKILLFFLIISSYFYSQGSPQITIKDNSGGESLTVDCNNPSNSIIQLNGILPTVNTTSTYSVSKNSTYTPYTFNTGTKQNTSDADNNRFFKKVNIGFDFCFFDKKYSEIVLGSNGDVTFDLTWLNLQDFPNFKDNNPSALLPNTAIFGAKQEGLTFSASDTDSGIYTETFGSAPFRKFVITYYNGKLIYSGSNSGCDNLRSTTQIVLHESLNIVEIFLDSKPMPCSDSGFKNALVGILDDTGSIGYSPSGRNTGVWQATKEAYSFTPSGNAVTPTLAWYDSAGTLLGNTSTINYKISKSDVITLKASYPLCSGIMELADTFPITVNSSYPVSRDISKYCYVMGENVSLNSLNSEIIFGDATQFNFKYYKTLNEAQTGIGTAINNIVISNNPEIVYARIENKTNVLCATTAVVKLYNALLVKNVNVCDIEKANYDLNNLLKSGIVDASYTGAVKYYLSATSTTPVTNVNVTDGMQIWIQLDTCSNKVGPITLHLSSAIAVNTPISQSITICDNNNDTVEPFDLSVFNSLFVSNPANYKIRYYQSLATLASASYDVTQVFEGLNKLYVRIENLSGGCYAVAELNLTVTFKKVDVRDSSFFYCFNGTDDVTINLTDPKYYQSMWASTPPALVPTFYRTYDDALNKVNPITSFTITQNANYIYEKFYARFDNDGCYSIKVLGIGLVNVELSTKTVPVCDNFNDGSETINLYSLQSLLFPGQSVNLKFYDVNTGAELTYLTVNSTNNTVKVAWTNSYNTIDGASCSSSDIITFNLQSAPNPKPSIDIIEKSVCDINANNYELFDATLQNSSLIANSSTYRFEYYDSYDSVNGFTNPIIDPTVIKISNNTPKTIYVKVISSAGCYNKSQINVTYTLSTEKIILHPAKLENCSLENSITYNLNDAISQMFLQSENSSNLSDFKVVYYKDYNATTEVVSNPIPSPNNLFQTGRSKITVYAKFTSPSGCYSITPIDLTTYLTPIVKNPSPTVNFCNTGVLLTDYENGMLLSNPDTTAKYNYSFYTVNPQTNPTATPIDKTQTFYPTDNQEIWYKVNVISDASIVCYAYGSFIFSEISQTPVTNPGLIGTNICDVDNDGKETFSIREKEADYHLQFPGATFTYYTSFPKNQITNPDAYNADVTKQDYIIVKIQPASGCGALDKLYIKFKKTPVFTINTPIYVCNGGEPITLTPDYSKNTALGLTITNYEWTLPGGTKANTQNLSNINIAGTYHLKITANNGCTYENDITVTATANPGTKLHTAKLEKCFANGQSSYDLNDAIPKMFIQSENSVSLSDFTITYYQNYDAATKTVSNPLPAPNNIFVKNSLTPVTIYAKFVSKSGCIDITSIELLNYNSPVSNNPSISYCKYATVNLMDYENGSLLTTTSYDATYTYVYTFYSSDPNLNPNAVVIDKTKPYAPTNGQKIWYKVQLMISGTQACYTVGTITFNETSGIAVPNPGSLGNNVCDVGNDGVETISLREKEAYYLTFLPDAKFTYYTSFPDVPIANPDAFVTNTKIQDFVYVKVESAKACSSVDKLFIKLKSTPSFIINSPISICPSEGAIIAPNYSPNVPLGLNIVSYEWTLPDGTKFNGPSLNNVTNTGTYHLKIVADNGCSYEKDIQINSYPVPKIYKVTLEGNTAYILVNRDANITNTISYKMDNLPWQSNYIFRNVPAGIHKFYVKYDGIDCSSTFFEAIIFTPNTNVITPNGDGVNDSFIIRNWNNSKASIRIVDRYGKTLYQQDNTSDLVWNGHYLGAPISTGSYWYVAKIGDGTELQGWIFVKNRE